MIPSRAGRVEVWRGSFAPMPNSQNDAYQQYDTQYYDGDSQQT